MGGEEQRGLALEKVSHLKVGVEVAGAELERAALLYFFLEKWDARRVRNCWLIQGDYLWLILGSHSQVQLTKTLPLAKGGATVQQESEVSRGASQ